MPCSCLQLVARLDDGPVGRPVADQANTGAADHLDLWLRNQRPRGLELARQPVEIIGVVVGALAVLRLLVVAGSAGEVRRHAVARHRAVRDAVTVDIPVAGELAQPLQRGSVEPLAAVERLGGVVKRLGHPGVHPEVEVRQHEHGVWSRSARSKASMAIV